MVLPFTNVEKSFVGDRFSEFQPTIPPNADYAVQVLPTMSVWGQRSLRHEVRRLMTPARSPLRPVRGPLVPDAEGIAGMPDGEAKEWAFTAGLRAYEHGYFDSARRCLERAARLEPENCRVRAILAACCLKLGDLPAALAAGRASLEIDPNDAHTRRLVGDICASAGFLEAAIEHYVRALEINPTQWQALRSIREVENRLQKGGAVGDQAEDAARGKLMDQLRTGSLDEGGSRALLLVRKRTREGLRALLPVATAAARYRTLDFGEVVAIVEIFDAVGDTRRRDEFLSMFPPAARDDVSKSLGALRASARTGQDLIARGDD
jgi:tetratricopeptide (TPR) repeat protein